MSSIPGAVAWPLLGYVVLVVIGRSLFVTEAVVDKLVNRLFLWSIAGLLLYRSALTPEIDSLAHQLALGCNIMTAMCLHSIAQLWVADIDADTMRRRQRWCTAIAAALIALIVVAGTPARGEGRLVDLAFTPDSLVVWIAYSVPLSISAALLIRGCVHEIRYADLGRNAKIVAYGLIAGNMFFFANLGLSVGQLVTGWHGLGSHLMRMELAYFACIAVDATFVAVPLVRVLLVRAGLDSDRRTCHRLHPLWRDVTSAVPEIVLTPADSARDNSETRLLRMAVEIRDALLHLGRHIPDPPRLDSEWTLTTYAGQLAAAIDARKSGSIPLTSGASVQLPPISRDFDAELRQLLELAAVWPTTTDIRTAKTAVPA